MARCCHDGAVPGLQSIHAPDGRTGRYCILVGCVDTVVRRNDNYHHHHHHHHHDTVDGVLFFDLSSRAAVVGSCALSIQWHATGYLDVIPGALVVGAVVIIIINQRSSSSSSSNNNNNKTCTHGGRVVCLAVDSQALVPALVVVVFGIHVSFVLLEK